MITRLSLLAMPLAVALTVGTVSTAAVAQDSSPVNPGSTTYTYQEHAIGSPDAPITVYEYSSLLCNHCGTFHAEVLPKVKEAYIDTGKVRWVFRDHSLGQPLALATAMMIRCAPADADYALRNMLFSTVQTWARAQNPLESLRGYLAIAGIDGSMVEPCLTSESILQGIRGYEREAAKLGIDSTPSFVLEGSREPLIGAQTFEDFQKIFDPILSKAGK